MTEIAGRYVTARITVELTGDEAWALAQLVKRMGLSAYRAHAQDDAEAGVMLEAADQLAHALAAAGYAPR